MRATLFLVIATLVAIVTAVLSGAAYREMRASALATTSARLDAIATQWARLLEASTGRELQALRAGRDSRILRDALDNPNARTRAAATTAVRPLILPGQTTVVQLLNPAGVEIMGVGNRTVPANPARSRETLDRAPAPDSGVVFPLRAWDTSIVATSGIRVTGADGRVRGYLVQTSFVHVNPSPETLNKLFGGESTEMRIANSDGSLWTDLEKPLPVPHLASMRSGELTSYTSPVSGRPVLAVFRPVARTPYVVVLQTAEGEVVAQAHGFLLRVLGEAALVIVLGLLVASWLSGSFTKPIARLTSAAEAVATGDYSQHLGLAPRGDELGKLARSFEVMISQIQIAFASREAAEENHRLLFESVPLPLWVYDLETLRIVAVNSAALHHYGYTRDEFLSMSVADIRPAEDVERLRDAIRRADGPDHGAGEWRHKKKDGTLIDVETHARSLEFQGRPARIVLIHDITERKRAKELIRRTDERYRRLVEEAPNGITLAGLDGRILAVNPAFTSMLGYDVKEVLALDAHALFPTPDNWEAAVARLVSAGQLRRHEVQLKRKDGSRITVLFSARLVTDPDSDERYLEAITEDVTDLRRVERQLLQAQKMDAVGKLASGVAHDFNNLLTVILSYSEILLAKLGADSAQRKDVVAIHDAGVSAATLTRQLLVFSRQQVIEPKVMRLNDLVTGTASMLTRLLGEHVELSTHLDPNAGAVKVDAGQMEQVIVNLAVNARDAMPNGGRLLIESKNVNFEQAISEREKVYPPGAHVMLSVSDNGIGMDSAVQARVFEPFFTTKAPGKGTGLGLATVYGIVKQSGGQIAVYSEPGRGTSFKIYLPRFDEASAELERPAAAVEPPGGTETILVVEDEPAVRQITRQVLEQKGYRVLEAHDGEQALEVALKHKGHIDLLVTDVIMPRVSGRELADRFTRLRPSAGILFVSGYTDDAIVHHGVLEREMHFLQKPFTPDALLRKVRAVLDGTPPNGAGEILVAAPGRDHFETP